MGISAVAAEKEYWSYPYHVRGYEDDLSQFLKNELIFKHNRRGNSILEKVDGSPLFSEKAPYFNKIFFTKRKKRSFGFWPNNESEVVPVYYYDGDGYRHHVTMPHPANVRLRAVLELLLLTAWVILAVLFPLLPVCQDLALVYIPAAFYGLEIFAKLLGGKDYPVITSSLNIVNLLMLTSFAILLCFSTGGVGASIIAMVAYGAYAVISDRYNKYYRDTIEVDYYGDYDKVAEHINPPVSPTSAPSLESSVVVDNSPNAPLLGVTNWIRSTTNNVAHGNNVAGSQNAKQPPLCESEQPNPQPAWLLGPGQVAG